MLKWTANQRRLQIKYSAAIANQYFVGAIQIISATLVPYDIIDVLPPVKGNTDKTWWKIPNQNSIHEELR
jgi:hypothetical protein